MSGSDDDDVRDGDEDPMLSSMRAVWVSMRDEEPSAKGLDALMAAARAQASRMQPEKPSWWQQLLASLRRPPVLALATVVVLLGGAVVVGKHREQLDAKPVLEPSVAPAEHRDDSFGAARQGAQKQDPAPTDKKVESGEDEKKPETVTATPTAPVTPARPQPQPPQSQPPRPARVDPPLGGEAQTGAGSAAPNAETERPAGAGNGGLVPPSDVLSKESTQNLPRGTTQLEIAVDGGTKDPRDSTKKDKPAVQDDEARIRATTPTAPTLDATKRPAPGRDAPPPRRTVDSDQLVKQTESAAANGDCGAVRVMAEQIRKMDSEAYKTRVKASSTIAKCLK